MRGTGKELAGPKTFNTIGGGRREPPVRSSDNAVSAAYCCTALIRTELNASHVNKQGIQQGQLWLNSAYGVKSFVAHPQDKWVNSTCFVTSKFHWRFVRPYGFAHAARVYKTFRKFSVSSHDWSSLYLDM